MKNLEMAFNSMFNSSVRLLLFVAHLNRQFHYLALQLQKCGDGFI
jgi:hypothetical protein